MQANNPNLFAFAHLAMPAAADQQNPHPAAVNQGAPAGPAVHAAAHLGAQLAHAQPQAVAGQPFNAHLEHDEPGTPPRQAFQRPINILDAPRRPAPVPMPAALNRARLLFPDLPALPHLPFAAPRAAAPAPLPPGLDAVLQGLAPVRVPRRAVGNPEENAAIRANFFNPQPQAAEPEAVDQQNSPSSASSVQTVVYHPGRH